MQDSWWVGPQDIDRRLMSRLEEVLEYAKRGWSLIPVGRDKKPLIKWEPYQDAPANEDQLREWFTKYPNANIGLVTGAVSGIVAVDIDSAEGGKAIQEYIPNSILCPTVATPRGRHLYFKHPGVGVSNNAKVIIDCDFRGDGGYILIPSSVTKDGKYEWILGPDEAPPPPLPIKYLETLIRSFKQPKGVTERNAPVTNSQNELPVVTQKPLQGVTNRIITLQKGQRDEDLFHVAYQLVRSRTSDQSVRTVLMACARHCNPPFDERDLEVKIESALKRARDKDMRVAVEARNWIEGTEGYFNSKDLKEQIGVQTKEQDAALRVALHRMVKDGFLERGTRDGVFRRVAPKSDPIEFKKVIFNPVALKWPFQLEGWVHTLPKSVIVVTGTPDSGKSAFLFNFVKLNQENFKIHYFTSEMGGMEMNSRLSLFPDIKIDEWDFDLREKADNFADEIYPEDINVIDFMEITKDHYLVAEKIKQIFDKLTSGVAVIALQKRPGDDLGRGGVASLEKPRLYLSMEKGRIKIIKAKNWTDPTHNPNGLVREYRLRHGCEFICDADWEREYGEDI